MKLIKLTLLLLWYVNYRIAIVPFFNTPIMTFKLWLEYVTAEDHAKIVIFDLFVIGWCIFGLWWTIAGMIALTLIFWIYGIYKARSNRQAN